MGVRPIQLPAPKGFRNLPGMCLAERPFALHYHSKENRLDKSPTLFALVPNVVEKGNNCSMSQSHPPAAPIFSQVDVTAGSTSEVSGGSHVEHAELLREVLASQDRTNEILEELVGVMAANQKQRAQELHQWRKANPQLSKSCNEAAEALSRVQLEYLHRMTDEINDTADDMIDGEFMLNEFVDRFGPRMAHLNGVIQVLAQLSSGANPPATQS
jgi:hypothetical protein